jgi:hypothetical protein
MNFFFFKRPKPSQFNYRPLYYDPEKEEVEERKRSLQSLKEGDPKERMRAEIRRRWKTDQSSKHNRYDKTRILFFFLIAAFAIYLIFFTGFVNKLVSLFLH